MSDRSFVDSNILIYAHDNTTGTRHVVAKTLVQDLWQQESGVLSTQVLQEFAVNLQRKTKMAPDPKATREIVAPYLAWDVVVNDEEAVLEALTFQARYGLSFWDALIVQAADASGATVLYTEDFSHGQKYGSVRAVNPFKKS